MKMPDYIHILDSAEERKKFSFCEEYFGGLPLSTVIELVKQHYPEYFI